MGDTGTGKTNLIYQDLLEAEANGTCCVVNDAKGGEIIARFFNPVRGDVIFNQWTVSLGAYLLAQIS